MPKVSVYLSDAIYEKVRARGLSVSTLAQRAIDAELRRQELADWIERERSAPQRLREQVDTTDLLDEVRAEFGQ
ncbi:MAG TPA: type II toxin-antitoxin system CcdA family antitoxin [Beutenbergiaceae bacterium]|nr:type II toxin-antitoxin system CcdA family antitoxin [Beutenbergiaceae bacterium]